jgi:hypothetical protein
MRYRPVKGGRPDLICDGSLAVRCDGRHRAPLLDQPRGVLCPRTGLPAPDPRLIVKFPRHSTVVAYLALLAAPAVGVAVLAPGGASAATKPSYKQLQKQVRDLKKSRDTWRRHADSVTLTLDVAQRDLDIAKAKVVSVTKERDLLSLGYAALTKQVNDLTTQVGILQGSVATVSQQRDQALAGLPAAIAAVPIADFSRLVFAPARAAWPCDSFFQSGSYWSYSYDSPGC